MKLETKMSIYGVLFLIFLVYLTWEPSVPSSVPPSVPPSVPTSTPSTSVPPSVPTSTPSTSEKLITESDYKLLKEMALEYTIKDSMKEILKLSAAGYLYSKEEARGKAGQAEYVAETLTSNLKLFFRKMGCNTLKELQKRLKNSGFAPLPCTLKCILEYSKTGYIIPEGEMDTLISKMERLASYEEANLSTFGESLSTPVSFTGPDYSTKNTREIFALLLEDMWK